MAPKKPRTKNEFVKAIVDLLFMKEPNEAEYLLNLLCREEDVMDNSTFVKHKLSKLPISELKTAYSLAVLVADATHCDELPKNGR